MKRLTIRMPEELHQLIRKKSFKTGKSQNQIMVSAIKEKYKEELKMKKYYLKEIEDQHTKVSIFLELEEDEIVEKLLLGDVVYTDDINDIDSYYIEHSPTDFTMSLDELENHILAWTGDFSAEQLEDLENGILTDEIIKTMKERGGPASEWETYLAYEYWDGSNHKEIILEGDWNDGFMDYTEEFSGMREIDSREYNTGTLILYRLKNDYSLLVDYSQYQGTLPEATLINKYDVETVREAQKIIEGEM